MFSTCITPRFIKIISQPFGISSFFFFFYRLLFNYWTHIHILFAFFAFCAVFNVWCFIFIWQALSYSVSVYLVSHYPHIWYSTYINALMVTDIKYKISIIPMMRKKVHQYSCLCAVILVIWICKLFLLQRFF